MEQASNKKAQARTANSANPLGQAMHRIYCTGKINYSLRICGTRADGYHLLDSIFLPLSMPQNRGDLPPEASQPPAALVDEIVVEHLHTGVPGSVELVCDKPCIDLLHNTVVLAHTLFVQALRGLAFTGAEDRLLPSYRYTLHKGIAQGAGLGGGSADAAGVLLYLQAQNPMPDLILMDIAAKVGADVPFFLLNTPCRVRGIGELLEPCLSPIAGLFLVLLCPGIHVSTPWAYQGWDELHTAGKKKNCFLTGWGEIDNKSTSRGETQRENLLWVENDLEQIVFQAHPELAWCKNQLLRLGAGAAGMSGSGSSIFGVFRQKEQAACAVKYFSQWQLEGYSAASLVQTKKNVPNSSMPPLVAYGPFQM